MRYCLVIIFSDLDFRITKFEIKKAVNSLKSGKATGLDKIGSEIIKSSVNVLHVLSVYKKLFNATLRSGIYPTSWHDSHICHNEYFR